MSYFFNSIWGKKLKMSTLKELWNFSKEDVNSILLSLKKFEISDIKKILLVQNSKISDNDISNIYNKILLLIKNFDISDNTPDINKRLLLIKIYAELKLLPTDEISMVKSPYFEDAILKRADNFGNKEYDSTLNTLDNLYEKNYYIKEDPRCQSNKFEGKIPIDPIYLEPIEYDKLFVLNNTCYDKDSIREWVSKQNTNIYTDVNRQPIPEKSLRELGIEKNNYLVDNRDKNMYDYANAVYEAF